jgi:hypothetical protein
MGRVFPLPQALLVAVLLHAAVFLLLSPAVKMGPHLKKTDLVFWGSILRAQDLMPVSHEAQGISDVRVIAPDNFVYSTKASAWKFGSSVEKPERPHEVVSFPEMFPQKFITDRVVLDNTDGEDDGVDLPKAGNISLKVIRP